MRISDWSSDVCSSDLGRAGGAQRSRRKPGAAQQPPRQEARADPYPRGHAPHLAAIERRGRGRAADRHHRAALAAISRDARAYPVRPVSKRRDPNPTFDLFIPLLNDLPLTDQREVMESTFFSLKKRQRLKPIEYRSPAGEAWVTVADDRKSVVEGRSVSVSVDHGGGGQH